MERKVWSEFQYTKKDGTVLKFSVIDCPKERMGDALDLYQKYFMQDESMHKLAGEYALPVWSRSAHTQLVDTALNDTCRVITGCLKPTPVEKLYPLAGVAPPDVRRDVASSLERTKKEIDRWHPLHHHKKPLITLCRWRNTGIAKSEEAKEEQLVFVTEVLKEEGLHIAICIENSTDSLVGVSSMQLTLNVASPLPDIAPRTKEVAKLFEIIGGTKEMYNVLDNYSVDKYYDGRGIIVHPDYRGFGIGTALVTSRKIISKDHGVPLSSAWMTSIGTQKAAERNGWMTPYEIDTHEFARKFNLTPYDGIPPTYKVMVVTV